MKQNTLRRLAGVGYRVGLRRFPDTLALHLLYLRRTGRLLRLRRPRTFNEKIQHRKRFERDARMPRLVDKIEAKSHAAALLGPGWIIPTLYSGPSLPPRAERNWPLPYVIKPSHRSGAVQFVRRESDVDWPRIEGHSAGWLANRYGAEKYEWAYSEITPRILVEECIGGETAPMDYKFFVFDGRVEFVQVHTDRETAHKTVFFDRNWQRQHFVLKYPLETREVAPPLSLDRMIDAAEKLGTGWPFVRVDLYEIEDHPKFGEMTFYPESGCGIFRPARWDRVFGDLWPMKVRSDEPP